MSWNHQKAIITSQFLNSPIHLSWLVSVYKTPFAYDIWKISSLIKESRWLHLTTDKVTHSHSWESTYEDNWFLYLKKKKYLFLDDEWCTKNIYWILFSCATLLEFIWVYTLIFFKSLTGKERNEKLFLGTGCGLFIWSMSIFTNLIGGPYFLSFY